MKKIPDQVHLRFYEELNRYLPKEKRKRQFDYHITKAVTIQEVLNDLGVPSSEIDLLLVNGESAGLDFVLHGNEHVSVYPRFERFNINDLTKIREKPLRELKFICDSHLGKLSKYLRMLGFDTLFANQNSIDQIIELSLSQNRIILSRNHRLVKHRLVTRSLWVRSFDPLEQIRDVVFQLDLQNSISPLTRCIVCNGRLEKIGKDKIQNRLEEETANNFNDFYICRQCGKIYWKGSHYNNMLTLIETQILQH